MGSGRAAQSVWPGRAERSGGHLPSVAVAAATIVLLLPLVVAPGGFHRYVTLRWALLGLVVAVGARSVRERLWRTIPRDVVAAWSAVLATVALASVTAVVPLRALIGESDRRAGLLSYLLVAGAFALGAAVRSQRTIVMRAGPVATGVVLLTVLVTFGTQELAASRAVLVGNPGQLGGYLVILAGLNLVVATTDPDQRWRRSAAVGAPVSLALVLFTGSYAAVIGGIALLMLFAMHRDTAHSSVRWWASAVGGAAVLGMAALAWPAQFRALGPSIQGRIDTWVVSMDVVLERPWVGWGSEGFRHGFALMVPESFVADWGDLRVQDRAHSLLLDHAAASGLLGLAALLLLAGLLARHILGHGDRGDRAVGVTLAAAGVFLAGWFLEFDLAAVLALLGGLASPVARRPADGSVCRVLTGVTVVSGVLVAVIGVVAVVGDVQFRRTLQEATDAATWDQTVPSEGADPASGARPDVDPLQPLHRAIAPTSGYTEMLAAIELAPAATLSQLEDTLIQLERAGTWHDPERDAEVALVHAQLHLERARHLGDRAAIAETEAAFEEVLQLAPTHSFAWRGVATARLITNDPAARDALMMLARLRPDDVGARHDLAVFEMQQGNTDGAAQWLNEACEAAPEDPQLHRLAEALREGGSDPHECVSP
jgi:hypothetical protein